VKSFFILKLGLKNLKRYKLRTFLTAGGVAISIGFISFLTSLGYGLEQVSTEQIANLDALQMIDVSIGKSKIVNINEDVIRKIMEFREVEKVYPEISVASELNYKGSKIDGIVYGKDTELLAIEKPEVSFGKMISGNNAEEVMLNAAAAKKMGITDFRSVLNKSIGAKMIIRPELLPGKASAPLVEERQVKVVGILEEGAMPYAYIPLNYVKDLGIVNFSAAKVKVKNKESVDKIKLLIEHMGFKVSTIKDTVDQVNQFFSVFRVVLVGFGTIGVVVACMAMFNTLTISLVEKTREIGIMKSLGTSRKDIMKIFLSEALLIGIMGGILGIMSSFLLGEFLNTTIVALAKSTGNTPVRIFSFPLSLVFTSLFLAFIISLLTGAYPAKRATKISALDALRYE